MTEGDVPGDFDFSTDDLALFDRMLADAGMAVARSTIPRRTMGSAPLSFSQELLWRLDQTNPGMTAYLLSMTRRIRGPLDLVALDSALCAVVARHEILRTRFVAGTQEPLQVVDAPVFRLQIDDVAVDPMPETAAQRRVNDFAARPFDLATEPAFRSLAVRLGPDDHLLVIVTHHIVFDGWSRGLLFRELDQLYRAALAGTPPGLEPMAIQFGDFAAWQRQHLSGDRLGRLLGYWRGALGDLGETAPMPTDFPRDAAPGFNGGRVRLLLPVAEQSAVRDLARQHGGTVYMVLMAAYLTVLHRYSGAHTVTVGSGSAGRTPVETEGLIGYFNNTLVLSAEFTERERFDALLVAVRDRALGAFDHQDVPLEKLMMELRSAEQGPLDAPFFRAVLTMQDVLETPAMLDRLVLEPFGVDVTATKFDLTLFPAERSDGLALTLQYRSDLYTADTAMRFLGHLRQVLASAAADSAQPIDTLTLLTPPEYEALAEWNRTATPIDKRPVHDQIAAVAARTPDAVALVCGKARVTYRDLDRRASEIGARLQVLGVSRGDTVGLLLDRSVEAIVALLGVLITGAAYLPLSPDAPPARLAQQLTESGTRVVVTRTTLAPLLADARVALLELDQVDAGDPPEPTGARTPVADDDLAYVLFTSGSTGTPKGVAVTHRNLANYVAGIRRVLQGSDTAPLHSATVSSLTADLGNTSIFSALVTGGTLHVMSSELILDGPLLAASLSRAPVDLLKITPSHLRALFQAAGPDAAALLPTRCLVLGGEASSWDLIDEIRRLGSCRVINHYGPTETTVGCATFEITTESMARARRAGAQTVPIGLPMANVQLHVLDAHGEQSPVTVPGELYVSGAGVASGYFRQPDRTTERFVQLAGPVRAYRTGDRVRRLPDGNLEFLGRTDDQVKIRGHRVELGEIEHALSAVPGVAGCAVVLHDPGLTGDSQLVAYVVAKTGGYASAHAERPTPERLRERLVALLPEYMVPAAIMMLDQLPLNANGKVDRRALPAPRADAAGNTPVAPRTPTEATLATIWAEALKREAVGVRENFFELGGHSLIAIRILGKLTRIFSVRLPLRALFDAPTVAQLAVVVDEAQAAGARPGEVPRTPIGRAARPGASQ